MIDVTHDVNLGLFTALHLQATAMLPVHTNTGITGITGITGFTSEYRKIQSFCRQNSKTVRFRFRVRLEFRVRVRVLIRFTCDSYVYACVVYCILRYSDVIPVIPMIPVIPVFVCTRNVTALTVHTFVDLRLRGTTCLQVFTQRMDLITDVGKTKQRQLFYKFKYHERE